MAVTASGFKPTSIRHLAAAACLASLALGPLAHAQTLGPQAPGRGEWGGIPVMGERLWIIESTTVGDGKLEQKLLPDHLKHQLELERTGVLFAAGPAIDIGTKKRVGIIIIRAASAEEADLIAKNDPMHAGGGRTYRIMQWMLNEGGFTMTMRFATGDYDFK